LQNQKEFNIQYCHCGSDFGLLTAAVTMEALGLAHSPIRAVINSLDKALMKKQWGNAINCPASILTDDWRDAERFAQKIGWPIIIKPTAASGSQGVGLAKNENELEKTFNAAMIFSPERQMIVEQFIRGRHHDVNGIFWRNVFYPAGIGDRFFTKLPYFVPHHGYFPSSISEEERQELYDLLEQGARLLGITHGPVKADCVIANGRAYVYEIANRFHGDIFTIHTIGDINKTNPLRQLFQWIFNGAEKVNFQPIVADGVGGWKTIFNDSELPALSSRDVGFFHKNKTAKADVVKNNDEIIGLAWSRGQDRDTINRILDINDDYEQV
jgi:hypothetical protein